MGKYLKSNEIASAWAMQSQKEGYCSSSMSFYGAKFYSYGTIIAEIVRWEGKEIFLVNGWNFSVTTSRHSGLVRSAIPTNAMQFEVPGNSISDKRPFGDPQRILDAWRSEIEWKLAESEKFSSSKKMRLVLEAHDLFRNMCIFAATFKKKIAFDFPLSDDEIANVVRERERRAKIAERDKKKRAVILRSLRRLQPAESHTARTVYAAFRKKNGAQN